ncbi:TrbG/VirB9 family P-type conjugative transfer protein [Phenylobacterium sp.]|jgi:type IV secretion system protein VirB9|uniref:TrbG/VirB9 family P-type conjugative transfer protein n=1 Tax=Phenylobacterium sp. TaxID=1871053 RepID=UPI002F3ECFD2
MSLRLSLIGLLLAAALPATPAQALEVPKGGPADPRIKTVDYDPSQVVRVVGVFRIATQIVFAANETVQHVALGDSSAWDVAADRNVLFIKPKARGAPTDLIVTTAHGGETRSYVFDLVTQARANPVKGEDRYFVLRFRYPADQKAHAQAAVSAAEVAVRQTVTELKLERGAVEGPHNLAYSEQGPADLQPSEVSDNGRFTVLRFPGAQALPAIYTVGPDGSEALAAFDVRGEFVVVHGVAPGLRLRRGREVLCITNDAYRPLGAPAGGLTAAGDVIRTDKRPQP